jgi:hypothetical protein
MSAARINKTWRQISAIRHKQNGVWVDHTTLYAKSENTWHEVDLTAEQKDPAYHVWKAYADDEFGTGISLEPMDKEYIGFMTGQTSAVVDLSDPLLFDWSLIVGTNIAVTVESSNGFFFKNNTGNVKVLSAKVMLNGKPSTDASQYEYRWTSNGQVIFTTDNGDFIGFAGGAGLYAADGTDPLGLNFESVNIDSSDVQFDNSLNLSCEVFNI